MQELMGNSANMMLAETDGGRLIATVEVVLLVSEPKYQFDPYGFVKARTISDIRFATGAKGLRNIAATLAELADEAERLEGRASLKPQDKDDGA